MIFYPSWGWSKSGGGASPLGGYDPGVLGPVSHVGTQSYSEQPEMVRSREWRHREGQRRATRGHWARQGDSTEHVVGPWAQGWSEIRRRRENLPVPGLRGWPCFIALGPDKVLPCHHVPHHADIEPQSHHVLVVHHSLPVSPLPSSGHPLSLFTVLSVAPA